MRKSRLEAFSDGVIAVIITIIVLELRVPRGADLASLQDLAAPFLSYVLSFVFIAIYWNNHHHMLHTVERVNGAILWANMHLLFWLSLVPFVTAWMAAHLFATWPTILYGLVLIMAAIAYSVLQNAVIHLHGKESILATAIGADLKGKVSILFYLVAIAFAFLNTWLSVSLYILVACLWFLPDRRIERQVDRTDAGSDSRATSDRPPTT
ncbi:conserved membrane hypothetical protein [Burkholderiales bacterium]|nr:conserved membrane hypothetical protein [Burkholderiales bacterium]